MRPNETIPRMNCKKIDSLLAWTDGVAPSTLHSLPAAQLHELCSLAKEAVLKRLSVNEETESL